LAYVKYDKILEGLPPTCTRDILHYLLNERPRKFNCYRLKALLPRCQVSLQMRLHPYSIGLKELFIQAKISNNRPTFQVLRCDANDADGSDINTKATTLIVLH
jgi:hypothetical protein